MISEAFTFAESCYKGQNRKTGEPFILHARRVEQTLTKLDLEPHVLDAALLHDAIESSDTDWQTISKNFDREVANIVYFLSKDSWKGTYKVRIQKYMEKLEIGCFFHPEILCIKLADQIDNLNTLHGFSSNQKRQKQIEEVKNYYLPFYRKVIKDIPDELIQPFDYLYQLLLQAIQSAEKKYN